MKNDALTFTVTTAARGEAEEILDKMFAHIELYGEVSIKDLSEMCGEEFYLPHLQPLDRIGWTGAPYDIFRGVYVHRVR